MDADTYTLQRTTIPLVSPPDVGQTCTKNHLTNASLPLRKLEKAKQPPIRIDQRMTIRPASRCDRRPMLDGHDRVGCPGTLSTEYSSIPPMHE